MGELKPGWKRVKLGQVALNSTTATKDPQADGFDRYVIGKHIPEEGGRITSSNPVGDAEFGSRIRTMVRAGDVVCTTRGPKLKVAVADFDCLSAHTNFILRPKNPAEFPPEILEAVVRSNGFQDHLRKHFRGSTNLFVNWSDAAEYEFALPPLEEQRRIAILLTRADDVVEHARICVAAAAAVRRAFDEDFFERASVFWPLLPVSSLCECFSRRHEAADKKFDADAATPGAVPVLRSLNVWPGRFDLTELRYISADGNAIQAKLQLHEGDLLVVRTGDAGRPGNAAVVREAMAGWNCLDLILMRPFAGVRAEYLEAALNRPSSLQRLTSLAPGTKQKHLTMTDLHRLLVPVPPLPEQAAYAQQRQAILEAIAAADDRLGEARATRSAMLRTLLEA